MHQLNWLLNVPRKKILHYGLTTAVIVSCITGGIILWSRHQPAQTVAEDIPLVRTLVVGSNSATQDYIYSGEVRGRFESQLAFQVGGKVTKRFIELGKTVRAGEVLMQIDPKDLQQTVNSSSAQVYSAESQLKLAKNNLSRYQQLYAQGAVSRAQLDQYQNEYDVAVASVQRTSAQLSQGVNQFNYSLLYADQPGVIASIAIEAGQVVSAGQTVLTIVQDGEREVEISVPENRIEELRKTTQIKATFWALPNTTIKGKVREIAPMADSTTRTYKVRISLINPPQEIKLGMTAAVTVSDSPQSASLTIPLSAVYQTGTSPEVWVVKDSLVSLRPVQTGNFSGNQIQVLAGLNPGETIVTAGVQKLRPGQKIRITGGDNS